MSTFLHHTNCPHCGSSDGVGVYSDGGHHCFVCDKTWKEGESSMSKKVFKNESLVEVTPITQKVRGIPPEIFSQYSYYRGSDGEHVANMYDSLGNVVAQKMRYPDKTFKWKGKPKEALPFGMHLWRAGGRKLCITEGELDCLSVATAFNGKYAVISLNNGVQGAKKELKEHIEYMNSFDEIYLWFDNDQPGKKGIQDVVTLFPAGKVYVVNAGDYKDANELLQAKGKAYVAKRFYEAQKYTPSGIVNANEGGFEAIMADDTSTEVYDTQYKNLEVSKGAITTFVSGSGMGKSTIIREIGHKLLTKDKLTIGHVALEENNNVSKRAYLGIELNKSLISKKKWNEYKSDKNNIKDLGRAYDNVIKDGRLYLYNHFGSLDSDTLLSKLRYLVVGAGCDFIILDHISIVVSGLEDMGDNERRVIDVLMTKLRSLVEETGVGMILVSHLKRVEGKKGHEDGIQLSLSHLRGSGSIAQLSDKVIGLEGNQQDEEHSSERVIRCLKDREEGERVGILGKAKYYADIGRLLPFDEEEFEDESEF